MLKAHRRFTPHNCDPREHNIARCTCRINGDRADNNPIDVACPHHLPDNYALLAARHRSAA
jgi:hypothetical protein